MVVLSCLEDRGEGAKLIEIPSKERPESFYSCIQDVDSPFLEKPKITMALIEVME